MSAKDEKQHKENEISKLTAGMTAPHVPSMPPSKCPFMSNSVGIPAPDLTHSINAGGHTLTADVFLMEKQQTFNRSKIVERHVHACGSGAFGYFELTKDLSAYTKAKLFNGVGKKTPIFTRFSTVTLGKEFPDSARNPRGFATKFYTEEGNYDIVGLNWPIFFVRDPAMGPDVIRSQQREPDSFLISFDAIFDWMSFVPESMHANTMFWSNHGTPRGWRHMHGYGCHTFKFVNQQGVETYCKYHFVAEVGRKDLTLAEAQIMSGLDPDYAKRDLFEWIDSGKEAVWKAYVQLMTPEQATLQKFDPFDVTKVWPRKLFPMIEFGKLVLNANPKNYHLQVEQAAFSPGALVPGIEVSPDPLLNMRAWFYRDTQYYRLGVNLHQIPVNQPLNTVCQNPFARDGLMRIDSNGGNCPPYYPNRLYNSSTSMSKDAKDGNVPKVCPKVNNWKPMNLETVQVADRIATSRNDPSYSGAGVATSIKKADLDDEFEQCRQLVFRVMSKDDRKHLFFNIANGLLQCKHKEIVYRFLAMCYRVHTDYAVGVIDQMTAILADKNELAKMHVKQTAVPAIDEITKYAQTHIIDQAAGYMEKEVSAAHNKTEGSMKAVGTGGQK